MYGDFLNTASTGMNFSPFTGNGTPQAVTATADSSIVDVTGAGSGNAPTMIGGYPATNTTLGFDMGVGDGMARPYVFVLITATTTVTGTLTISLKAAPDNGSYGQGTYTTLYTSAALTGATQLAANKWLYFPVPPILGSMGEANPRFYKLTYTVGSSISLSLSAGIVVDPTSFLGGTLYNNNYIAI